MNNFFVRCCIVFIIAAAGRAGQQPPEMATDPAPASASSRRSAIAAEESRLLGVLNALTDASFRRLDSAKAKAAELAEADSFYAEGAEGWLGIVNFFKTFAQQDPTFESFLGEVKKRKPIPPWKGTEVEAIKSLDRQLRARGIDLIVVVHPFKEEVYPQFWMPSLKPGDLVFPELIPMVLSLLREDVEVIYLVPRFLEVVGGEKAPGLFEPTREMHWTHAGVSIAAKAIAERLTRYGPFGDGSAAHRYRNDDDGRVYDGARLYETDLHSPILVMGDSFTGNGPEYIGLHAQIAKEIGYPTGHLWISGGARSIPRTLADMGPEYLAGRKVVVWNIGSALFRPLHETEIATVELPRAVAERPSAPTPRGQVQLYVLVEETSEVPDPEASLYDDAITVSTLRVQNVEKGDVDVRRLRAAQWVMKQRSLDPIASKIAKGDHVRVIARPFEDHASTDPQIETVQRSDDTTNLDLPLYWIDEWHLIKRKIERD